MPYTKYVDSKRSQDDLSLLRASLINVKGYNPYCTLPRNNDRGMKPIWNIFPDVVTDKVHHLKSMIHKVGNSQESPIDVGMKSEKVTMSGHSRRGKCRLQNRTPLACALAAALALHGAAALVPYHRYLPHANAFRGRSSHLALSSRQTSSVRAYTVSTAVEDVEDSGSEDLNSKSYSPLNVTTGEPIISVDDANARSANMLGLAVSNVEVPSFEDLSVVEKESGVGIKAMLADIRLFTLPLLAVWLSNPLLSLIDTAAVGNFAGVYHLAALGPATALCDQGTYLLSFLTIVTTSQLASAFARNDKKDASRNVEDALLASFICGVAWSALLLSPLGVPVVKSFIPKAAQDILPLSLSYARIRAFGFVPALASLVLQASSLARRAISIPLIAVGISSLGNLLGDGLLVGRFGMGVNGAAIATVVAQILSCAILLKYEIPELTRSDRGLGLRVKEASRFLALCIRPAMALIGKVTINFNVAVTAATCGLPSLAAHQVCTGVYFLLSPMGEALSQTVQNLLPKTMQSSSEISTSIDESTKSDEYKVGWLTKDARRLVKVVAAFALALGVVDAVVGAALPAFFPGLFTPVAAVIKEMKVIAPLVGGCLLFHALSTTLEGVLFATRDTAFLSFIYPLNSLIAYGAFNMIRNAKGLTSLKTVWLAYVTYQVTRCTQFFLRILWNQRQKKVVVKNA
uniref:Multidrug and toxic compound extrusion protein n=1 Tax=Octactis speculum TaxID=3111310 RepID=A0A7S2BGX8_9STRA|mmetsp:Transcript_23197/g.31719  ORF Transcript_23197/g.31719 Transcript_23197/m.31719 type:complete len:688 (+) Transcript_23197:1-2064(+)